MNDKSFSFDENQLFAKTVTAEVLNARDVQRNTPYTFDEMMRNNPALHNMIHRLRHEVGACRIHQTEKQIAEEAEMFMVAVVNAAAKTVIEQNMHEITGMFKRYMNWQDLDQVKENDEEKLKILDALEAETDFSRWSNSLAAENNDFYWEFVTEDLVGVFSSLCEETPIEVFDYDEEFHDKIITKVEKFVSDLVSGEIELKDAYKPSDLRKILKHVEKDQMFTATSGVPWQTGSVTTASNHSNGAIYYDAASGKQYIVHD